MGRSIEWTFSNPGRRLITIPITGHIRGDLRVTPPSVFFGFVKVGEKAEQQVTIESRSIAAYAFCNNWND